MLLEGSPCLEIVVDGEAVRSERGFDFEREAEKAPVPRGIGAAVRVEAEKAGVNMLAHGAGAASGAGFGFEEGIGDDPDVGAGVFGVAEQGGEFFVGVCGARGGSIGRADDCRLLHD